MRRSLIYLLIILIVATTLRTYHLNQVPPSLFGDEVDVGYQAYSILKTGQDVYGQSFPTLIHSFSEYRAPLFIYSTIPFIAAFGLNEWGVRAAAAFWGILVIVGIFLLTRRLFNERIALFAALFLSLSPWHIQYSRAGFEITMLLAVVSMAAFLFIKGIENKYLLILSGILFALTPYIYSSAVVFMPLLFLVLTIINYHPLKKLSAFFLITILTMLFVLTPYIANTISGKAGERFSVVSVFTSKDLTDKVTTAQQREQLPLHLEKIFHNKPIVWAREISLNYLRAFSPEFLFLTGDPNPRHSVHEMGQMYLFEIAFLLAGVWILIKEKFKYKWLILGWLLISPLPAALTFDGGFHATRNFLMLPPLVVIVALGLNYFWENIRRTNLKYLSVVLMVMALFNIGTYLHHYFVHYPKDSWRAWHFGFKQAMQYVGENSGSFRQIFINNSYEPALIRFLFWTGYDPAKFHQNFTGDKMVQGVTDGFNGFALEYEQSASSKKYFFGKFDTPFEEKLDKNRLFVASAREDITNLASLGNSNVRLLKIIYSPTNEPIFYILTGQR